MARKLIESDEMLQVLCNMFLLSIAERKKKGYGVKDEDLYCTYYWGKNFDRVEVDEVVLNGRKTISISVGDYEYVSNWKDDSHKRDILLLLVAKLEELFKQ